MIFILFIVLNRYIKNAKNTKLNVSKILITTNPIVNPAYFYESFDIPNVYVTFRFIYSTRDKFYELFYEIYFVDYYFLYTVLMIVRHPLESHLYYILH